MENNDDKYLPELQAEKDSLDSSFTHAMKLLNAENKVVDEDADRALELHEHFSSRRRRCMSRLASLSQVFVGGVLIWALSFLQAPR
ncbi:KH domain-containing, RNA-binding, signal transduction-associated protein 1 [Liparis tanakae]|uniref:KH domain-containing, RNA-binding, signal transduction-associated protein 1 n=1 Tax=Liparis tanakae TaxID=230148 RepID=A0A4Z2FLL5_9TELE|nr:KH domain-containing, RNA-binding, signal transduction-associated protein 1 [Liparis tanakae]